MDKYKYLGPKLAKLPFPELGNDAELSNETVMYFMREKPGYSWWWSVGEIKDAFQLHEIFVEAFGDLVSTGLQEGFFTAEEMNKWKSFSFGLSLKLADKNGNLGTFSVPDSTLGIIDESGINHSIELRIAANFFSDYPREKRQIRS